jgi:alpha-1,2-mannosyltransferase
MHGQSWADVRQKQGPLVPSLSVALRMLLLVRTAGAMFSIIADCDEGERGCTGRPPCTPLRPVFNFLEPLHYFLHNSGYQTWELSPQFAIRSWAYILLHWPLASLGPRLLRLGKVSCPRTMKRTVLTRSVNNSSR